MRTSLEGLSSRRVVPVISSTPSCAYRHDMVQLTLDSVWWWRPIEDCRAPACKRRGHQPGPAAALKPQLEDMLKGLFEPCAATR